MKAWFVWVIPPRKWGDFVHGCNATAAKSMFWKAWSAEANEWIRLHPKRIPELDNVSITSESILRLYPDSEYWWKNYKPICKCPICLPQSME